MDQNLMQQLGFGNTRASGAAALGAALTHGKVGCWYDASSETDRWAKATEQTGGYELPDADNVLRGMLRIIQAPDRRSVSQNMVGEAVEAGLCLAQVYVPASTAIPAGTGLTIATEWDATNNKVLYQATVSTAQRGVLEAVIYNGAIIEPANPIAILQEAIASDVARIVTVLVYAVAHHAPMPFSFPFYLPGATAKTDMCVLLPRGPVLVGGGTLQMLTTGTTASGSSAQLEITPWRTAAQTADQQAIYSTALNLGQDATDGNIAGAEGVTLVGITDTGAGVGTGGSNGVRIAGNLRQMPTRSHLALTFATGATSPADYIATIFGHYL